MEQNILKRYNEIHTMLWEEVIKVFASRTNERIYQLIDYIIKCINGKKEFNLGAYMSLRKAIMKKMYIVAHLEWRYEE